MKPYYSEGGITVFHGDCREVLSTPAVAGVGAVVTDPPYGIGAGRMSLGKWRTSRMEKADWDAECPDLTPVLGLGVPTIIWGGNYFNLPQSRCFLVWDKGAGFRGRDFAECEQAWCSFDAVARLFQYDPLAGGDYKTKVHPTQKPVPVMAWCLSFLSPDAVVLDPYMGSGTTLVAAKLIGRRAIGIEKEERWCEWAAKRLAQGVLFGASA